MPCIEVSLPEIDKETRSALAAGLTEAFCSATGHPAQLLGVRFFEYPPASAANGGKLCDSPGTSPYLHVLLYCPRLKRSVKQKVGAALTGAFAAAVKKPDWIPIIHICEHPFDNIVVGGKLLSDAYEECSKRGFYYELPKD
jgi:phenylpyruvate tautomerase PptA (4-oxalocrotonate tautomerase family)